MNRPDHLGPRKPLDAEDRRIIAATQSGLPLCSDPYESVARQTGMDTGELMARMTRMLDAGIIRRIGAVPNHYAVGYRANGMSVWDVPDDRAEELGHRVGALEFVTHCYRRPRHGDIWPYNLFAMVHGRDRTEVEGKVANIFELLGDACRANDILYSTRILKKTGLRIGGEGKN